MDSFSEYRFRAQVDAALAAIRTVLDTTRNPQYPADVPHAYTDKYLLAEFLTNTALAADLNVLEAAGLSTAQLAKLKEWSASRSVTLRLRGLETCTFDKKVVREVESATKHVGEYENNRGTKEKYTSKVVTTVTEWFWHFDVDYSLVAYQGNSPDDALVLQSRKGRVSLMTTADATPKPKSSPIPNIDVNITWLLQQLDLASTTFRFAIDRTAKSCHTPRRNANIGSAFSFFGAFRAWAQQVHAYFGSRLFPVQPAHGLDLGSLTDAKTFVPVVPLFEALAGPVSAATPAIEATALPSTPAAIVAHADAAASKPVVLPIGDINRFLAEQKRSLEEKFAELAKVFPAAGSADAAKLITFAEAKLQILMLHAQRVSQFWADGVEYIEDMLRKQLIAAIGKEVTPVDFANYMRYHNRKLFLAEYEPVPFCYAIRRPEHYPEGLVSVEAQLADGALADPLYTSVRHSLATRPMRFALNAATNVSFMGDRFLHAFVGHQFSGYSGSQLQVVARARQFSSFILLVGSIASADVFLPKYAIIIKNKDDLKIPLMLEQIPTPKAFRDAIESLSPEQQRFAKAIRGMQLASTLFALCVIQIKPQLEKLLKLPDDSLTKEIRLTQDLQELFITYQIPSDLLSYDGHEGASTEHKLAVVKGYVKTMQQMIDDAKKQEIADKKQEAQFSVLSSIASTSPVQYQQQQQQMPQMAMADMAMPEMAMRRSSVRPTSSASPSMSVSRSAAAPVLAAAPAAAAAAAPAKPAADPKAPKPEAGKPDEPVGQVAENEVDADYTKLPALLDAAVEKLDTDSALHATIITPGKAWVKSAQKALLAAPVTTTMLKEQHKDAKNSAFDLLDALSRSGSLAVDQASLHVVVASTHCFDKTLMDTVVQDNVNPIEKLERSVLIVASAVQGKPAAQLIKPDQLARVQQFSPTLFEGEHAAVAASAATPLLK